MSSPEILNDLDNPDVLSSLKLMQILSGGFGMFLLPALVSALFFGIKPGSYLQTDNFFSIRSFLLILLIAFASVPFINWMVEINSAMKLPSALSSLEQWMKDSEAEATRLTEAFLKVNSTGDLITNLFMIALLPALSEEFFFRGVIQKTFSQMTKNIHAGVILGAIVFSAIHMQFYGFLPRMMLGIFLGYLLVWSGSIWLPVAAHFINNASAVILSYYEQKGLLKIDPDEIGTSTNEQWLLAASIIVTAFLIFLLYKNRFKKAEMDISASAGLQ